MKDIIKNRASVSKLRPGISLHKFIAAGGNPKNHQNTKGLNSKTINNLKK